METVRIALAQINVTVGALQENREKIVDYTRQAQKAGACIVAFPELALTGYPPEDLLLKRHFIRDNLKELHHIVKLVKNTTVVVGFVDMDKNENVYNAAAIIRDGRLKGVYHKIHLPNYGVFDEKRYFRPGEKTPLFNLGRIKFGVNICEDIWQKNNIARLQSDKGANLIINISASPYYAGKGRVREEMLTKLAGETKAYICYANLVGGQDELVFDGGSLILDSRGEACAHGKQFEEDLLIADLAIRGELKTRKAKDRPPLERKEPEKLGKINEIYNALVLGTHDYVKKNGFKKVVIGLSGGIDSSLTAVIACDAIGNKNVVGISMPSRYSSEETQNDAKLLAYNLDIKHISFPIESIFNVYLSVLEREFFGLGRDVTEENLQARIRGNILMALSNKFGWLVLTTGNKSETSCGYCTLYGDTAGGFAVVKDVPKTLVYELAKFKNSKADKQLIPASVLGREPSAELKHGQKDSDTLPPYEVLDIILKKYVEEDKNFEEIKTSTGYNCDIIKEVIQKIDKSEYKRRQSPPGIKITPKAFGKDRRLPITNRYKER